MSESQSMMQWLHLIAIVVVWIGAVHALGWSRPDTRTEGERRLHAVLKWIGITGNEPSHHRYNLLHAIYMFATLNKDTELEQAADKLMLLIQAENEKVRGSEL